MDAVTEGRFPTGHTVKEVVQDASDWWDSEGRYVIRAPGWIDQDVGIKSGITRGLAWEQLNKRERHQIVRTRYYHHFRIPRLLEFLGKCPKCQGDKLEYQQITPAEYVVCDGCGYKKRLRTDWQIPDEAQEDGAKLNDTNSRIVRPN